MAQSSSSGDMISENAFEVFKNDVMEEEFCKNVK
jgi:hypothetical protein